MHKRSSRLKAARQLLHRHQMRETVRFAPQPGLRNSALAGLQVAVAALIALPLIYLSPFSHLIGFASLGTLVGLFGRFARQTRRGKVVFLCVLSQTVTVLGMSTAVWLGVPVEGLLLLLALACGILFYLVTVGDFGPPGALIFVFAASVSMSEPGAFSEVLQRTAATAAAALLAWLICVLTERLREHHADATLVGAVRPQDSQLMAVGRIILGAAIAAFIAHAVGGNYPGWAAMGAVAVLQGTHLHISMNRALQRTGGNIIGALLVGLFLVLEPSIWTVIFLVAFLTFVTEIVIGANYGLGQILVTPMALLMSYLAAPELAGVEMAHERVVDTVIGTGVGMSLAIAFSTLEDRVYLARHHSDRSR